MAAGLTLTGFVSGLANSSGQLVGLLGPDGREYLINSTTNLAATAAPLAIFASGASFNYTFGTVTISGLRSTLTDSSGTPGAATQNVMRGRAAFAAASNSVVITNSLVAATSTILVSLGGTDTTLTTVRVTAAAGSFTVTGNANATATTPFDYVVVAN